MPNVYATVAKCIAQMGGQLYAMLDVEEGSDISNNATLTQAIHSANDTVDTYLRSKYTLPLPGTPTDADYFPALCGHAVNIARYQVAHSRNEVADENDTELYKDALRFLGDLAKGISALTLPEPAAAAESIGGRRVSLGSNSGRDTASTPCWLDR